MVMFFVCVLCPVEDRKFISLFHSTLDTNRAYSKWLIISETIRSLWWCRFHYCSCGLPCSVTEHGYNNRWIMPSTPLELYWSEQYTVHHMQGMFQCLHYMRGVEHCSQCSCSDYLSSCVGVKVNAVPQQSHVLWRPPSLTRERNMAPK